MAKTFALVSTKGGVGKTTLCANLGALLADMGQSVLMVDADHQQSLSAYYPLETQADYGLRRLIQTAEATGCISQTAVANLDVVVSDDPDQSLNTWLRQSSSRFQFLRAALLGVADQYDFIFTDTQGSDGTGGLQEMAIRASDCLLSPIDPDWIAAKEFVRHTVTLLARLEPPPGIIDLPAIPPMIGIIYGLDRTVDTRRVVQELRKTFYAESGGRVSMLNTAVPSMAAYNQAAGRQVPVHRHEVTRRNSPTPSAHDTMLALVYELLPHLADVLPAWDEPMPAQQRAAR